MKIALYGASGMIGQRLLAEALNRGHHVTALVRNPEKITTTHPHLTVVQSDATQADTIAHAVAGHDAVINSVSPDYQNPQSIVAVAHAFLAGLAKANVKRIVVVGGAGSLEVAPGVQLVDTNHLPEEWKPMVLAQRDALGVYRTADLDWTYFSPAGIIEPGERTGKFRLGGDQLLVDENGVSKISCEDYAIALLDEIENPNAIGKRITIAY